MASAISPELLDFAATQTWVGVDQLGPDMTSPPTPAETDHPQVFGRFDPADGSLSSLWIWRPDASLPDAGDWEPFVSSAPGADTYVLNLGWESRHHTKHARQLTTGPAGDATVIAAVASASSTSPLPFKLIDHNDAVILSGVMPADTEVAQPAALALTLASFGVDPLHSYGVMPTDAENVNADGDWIWPAGPTDGRGLNIVISVVRT